MEIADRKGYDLSVRLRLAARFSERAIARGLLREPALVEERMALSHDLGGVFLSVGCLAMSARTTNRWHSLLWQPSSRLAC